MVEIETRIEGSEIKVKFNKRPIILASATLTVLIITLIAVAVYFSVDEFNSKIVLGILLSLIFVLAILMIIYTIILRKNASKRKVKGSERLWVRSNSTFEAKLDFAPSAPPLSLRASWALHPRKWSTATTLPAYHQTRPSTPQIIAEQNENT